MTRVCQCREQCEQQRNECDCGVFVVIHAIHFLTSDDPSQLFQSVWDGATLPNSGSAAETRFKIVQFLKINGVPLETEETGLNDDEI